MGGGDKKNKKCIHLFNLTEHTTLIGWNDNLVCFGLVWLVWELVSISDVMSHLLRYTPQTTG